MRTTWDLVKVILYVLFCIWAIILAVALGWWALISLWDLMIGASYNGP